MEIKLSFKRNGKKEYILNECDEFKTQKEELSLGYRIIGTLYPKSPVIMDEAIIALDDTINETDIISQNGFQSWSETSEYIATDTLKDTPHIFRFINKYLVDTGGDRSIHMLKEKPGFIQSHSYLYIRDKDNKEYKFYGSINNKVCFTVFESDYYNQKVRVFADFKNTPLTAKKVLFDFLVLKGTRSEVFDTFFDEMVVFPLTYNKLKGFTSWYNYYYDINEEIILKNIDNFAKLKHEGERVHVFQIDDGYQMNAGDWLSIDTKKFPNGLSKIADRINDHFISGLWLAPFIISPHSELYKKHPEYVLKNDKGKAPRAFYANKRCYVLDIYNPEAIKYLRKVFNTVFDKWHFKMVKLDFLYAASLIPRLNKSRGEVMYDACLLLRRMCESEIILGCGVPLESIYGIFEYSRIGCDVSLNYTGDKKMAMVSKEAVSTKNAILDTVNRYVLNERAILNDPDVFFLRQNNIELSHNEKMLLAVTNAIFGSVLFTSDDFSLYENEETYNELKFIWHLNDSKVLDYNIIDKDKIKVLISLDDKEYTYYLNSSDEAWEIDGKVVESRNYLSV